MAIRRGMLLLVVRIVILTLVLIVVQALGAWFLPGLQEESVVGTADAAADRWDAAPPSFGLVASIALLQTIALAIPVVKSRWSGWRLTGATFILFFGTVTFMSQIESLIYLGGKMPPGMLAGLFFMGLFNAAVFSPIMVLFLGRWSGDGESFGEDAPLPAAPAAPSALKLALASVVYLACYYLFGYFVAWKDPAVRAYYGGADPGTFAAQMIDVIRTTPWMLPFQLLRGLLWVFIGLLAIRMMHGRCWLKGLALSLLFSVPMIYLLYPNPMMPQDVRMAHLLETAPYQFLFGWFVAWLFDRRPQIAVGGRAAALPRRSEDRPEHSEPRSSEEMLGAGRITCTRSDGYVARTSSPPYPPRRLACLRP